MMNMKMKATGFGRYALCAGLVGLGMIVTTSRSAVAATVTAGDVNVSAGSTSASVPITLDAGSAQILNIQFALAVVAQGGAPAITAKLTYSANTPPGNPGLTDDTTIGQFLVGYPSDISPPLTGSAVIGTLGVPIPAGATGSYQVQVLNPSALDPDGGDVAITGAPGTITIAEAPVNTPTSTPTNTAVPPTVTKTPVPPTITPTRQATNTAVPAPAKQDDDGCQITSMQHGRTGWLLVLPMAGLLWLRRRSR